MQILVLNEMAKLGSIYLSETYDVYYFDEGIDKFDHIHLKQGNQNKAEFWYTNLDRFIPKVSEKKPYRLKDSWTNVNKALLAGGFIAKIKQEAIKVHKRIYPYIENKEDIVNMSDLNKFINNKEEDNFIIVDKLGKLKLIEYNDRKTICIYKDILNKIYLFYKVDNKQLRRLEHSSQVVYIYTEISDKELNILHTLNTDISDIFMNHFDSLFILDNSSEELDFNSIDIYLPDNNFKLQYFKSHSLKESELKIFDLLKLFKIQKGFNYNEIFQYR